MQTGSTDGTTAKRVFFHLLSLGITQANLLTNFEPRPKKHAAAEVDFKNSVVVYYISNISLSNTAPLLWFKLCSLFQSHIQTCYSHLQLSSSVLLPPLWTNSSSSASILLLLDRQTIFSISFLLSIIAISLTLISTLISAKPKWIL